MNNTEKAKTMRNAEKAIARKEPFEIPRLKDWSDGDEDKIRELLDGIFRLVMEKEMCYSDANEALYLADTVLREKALEISFTKGYELR